MSNNLKLWLISQTKVRGYDTYDSAVVVARDEAAAKRIYPGWYYGTEKPELTDVEGQELVDEYGTLRWHDWPTNTAYVTATFIGEAATDLAEVEVVCASFNGG